MVPTPWWLWSTPTEENALFLASAPKPAKTIAQMKVEVLKPKKTNFSVPPAETVAFVMSFVLLLTAGALKAKQFFSHRAP